MVTDPCEDCHAAIDVLAAEADCEIRDAHRRLRALLAPTLRAAPAGAALLHRFDRAFRDLADAIDRHLPRRPIE
jgi:hypothetical protein